MFDTLDDLPPGRRVLVRLDLNSPVDDGVVVDNRRVERHAETVRELAAAGHRVVLMAHQGRPGDRDFVSLQQHASLLAKHAGVAVEFVESTFDDSAVAAIRALGAGDVLLLENVRMNGDELPEAEPGRHADSEFVRTLAPEFDAYVNDAYSAAHRAHASLVGFPLVLPAYAGRVMEAEYEANRAIATREFDGRVTVVVGGTNAADAVAVIESLDDRVDTCCLGGVAGELFLRADGRSVGVDAGRTGRLDDQWERSHEAIEALLAERGGRLELPVDLAYEDDRGDRGEIPVASVSGKDRPFLDIGTETVSEYVSTIRDSDAVFVVGTLGRVDDERFAVGTVGVLDAIAETDCVSVVGGGDVARTVERYELSTADFSHVSVAGGAYVRAVTGEPLVGVELLKRE